LSILLSSFHIFKLKMSFCLCKCKMKLLLLIMDPMFHLMMFRWNMMIRWSTYLSVPQFISIALECCYSFTSPPRRVRIIRSPLVAHVNVSLEAKNMKTRSQLRLKLTIFWLQAQDPVKALSYFYLSIFILINK